MGPDDPDQRAGPAHVTHAALPHLVTAAGAPPAGGRRGQHHSTAGRVARPGSSIYNLTKFGVNAFSEALRQELIGKRVRVGVVEPGTVDTELRTHLPATSRRRPEAGRRHRGAAAG